MGKVAIITGASAGIGHTTALYFLNKGYKVYNLSRRTVTDIESIPTDITDPTAVKAAVDLIIKKEGAIDVLICNAGMGISGAVEDTPIAAVEKIFNVNFYGVLNIIQAVTPYMRERKSGTIITVSSAASRLSIPFQAFYSATKSAVLSLSEALRLELAPFNVKVTSILPGDVKTEFTEKREKNVQNNPNYGERIAKSVAVMEKDEQNGMSPAIIAKQIFQLAETKNPPVSVVGGKRYALLVWLSRVLPSRLISYVVGKLYG